MDNAKKQHFEVLFIGREVTYGEIREAIQIGFDEMFTRAGHPRDEEWQLEVALLDPQDAHIA